MATTSLSLLDRLRDARADDPGWIKFQDIYLPFIRLWLARVPGLGEESSDLAQEILIVVVRVVPTFDRRREGSFRAWLREVTVRQIRSYRRQRARRPLAGLEQIDSFLDGIADPAGSLARDWDRQHDQHVTRKLLAVVRPDFSPHTWDAFRRFCIDGEPARVVAEELGISENAVILAKHRVLKRLRQEAGQLLA